MVIFLNADKNHNHVVTLEEFRDALKLILPEDSLSLVEVKNIVKAFDTNRNGLIEEAEFLH